MPLTPDQRRTVVSLYLAGGTISDIGKHVGCDVSFRNTVRLWIRRYEAEGDVKRHPPKPRKRITTAEQDAAIVANHTAGQYLSTREIATAYGISMETVRRRLHAAQIKEVMHGKGGMHISPENSITVEQYHKGSDMLLPIHSQRANVTMQEYFLFDFTKTDGVDNWVEQSDTLRDVGMSKAVFVIHQNMNYRRAVFFSLLNPQPNGAGFAGVRNLGNYNLWGHSKLQIFCKSQGQYNGYKIILRHKCLNDEPNNSYEQYFQAPKDEFAERSLPFSEFKAYYRGKRVNTSDPLDISQITSIGIQAYGGIYRQNKQKGPATLEIDWIKAIP